MCRFTQQSRAPFQTDILFGSCGVGEKPIINHRGMWRRIAAETTDVAGFRSRGDGEGGTRSGSGRWDRPVKSLEMGRETLE